MARTLDLFFDLDGTLTDPAPGITACLAYALERMGRVPPPQQELARFIGPPLRGTFARLLGSDGEEIGQEEVEQAVAWYRERFSTTGLFENAVYAGIPEVLGMLRDAGHLLRVVTSKPTVFAEQIVGHFGLKEFFLEVVGSELSGERSEKSELVAHALRSACADAARTVMIGDRAVDILGARANGVRSVGVLWGFGTEHELREAGPDCVVGAVEEIPPAIDAS